MFFTPFSRADWHVRTPGWKRRLARVALRDAVLVVVLIALGEAAVRVLAPEYRQYIYSDTVTGGHPHLFNSLGLREREFAIERAEDEVRVLCLGNSVTRGTGIAQEDTYPKQLERMLEANGAWRNWFVINGGGEGQSTERALTFLESVGVKLEPATVVLGFSPSMLGVIARQQEGELPTKAANEVGKPQQVRQDLRSVGKRVLLGSYLYAFLNSNARTILYRFGVLRDRVDVPKGAVFAYAFQAPGVDLQLVEEAYAELKKGLVRLRDLAEAQRIRLIVLGVPPRFEISTLPEDNDRGLELRKARILPLARVAEYCRELDIEFVDATPALREARKRMLAGELDWDDLYVSLDYTHLNPAGQAILAETLLEPLTTTLTTSAEMATSP